MIKHNSRFLLAALLVAALAGCTSSHVQRRAEAYQEMGQIPGRAEQLEAVRAANADVDARDEAKARRQMNREDRIEEMQDRERELTFELKELEAKLAKAKLNRLTTEEVERTKTAHEKVRLELEQMRAEAEATRHTSTQNIRVW